jgi:hypothetical protein
LNLKGDYKNVSILLQLPNFPTAPPIPGVFLYTKPLSASKRKSKFDAVSTKIMKLLKEPLDFLLSDSNP